MPTSPPPTELLSSTPEFPRAAESSREITPSRQSQLTSADSSLGAEGTKVAKSFRRTLLLDQALPGSPASAGSDFDLPTIEVIMR
jgi:hypothetical protein